MKMKRHSVAVPSVTRLISSTVKAKGWTKDKPLAVIHVREEMVHMHDVYRVDTKGPEGKVLWHRGAKVGVA
jgi:hypothetical protein